MDEQLLNEDSIQEEDGKIEPSVDTAQESAQTNGTRENAQTDENVPTNGQSHTSTYANSSTLPTSTEATKTEYTYNADSYAQSLDSYYASSYMTQSEPAVSPTAVSFANVPGTNLFVNCLTPEITDEILKQMFAPFGNVVSAKVMIDLKTKYSKGYGFVKFESPQQAAAAVTGMNNKPMPSGKVLSVKYADSTPSTSATAGPSGTPSTNVFVKGLPVTYSEGDLQNLFASFGQIEQCKLLKDLASGLSRGQGFVRFLQIQSAEAAIKGLNGYLLPGTVKGLVVRYADTEEEKVQRKEKVMRKMGTTTARYSPYGMTAAYSSPYAATPYAATPYAAYGQAAYGAAYGAPGYVYPGYTGAVPTTTAAATTTSAPSGTLSNENCVFIYHLPASTDDTLLYKLFGPFGPILSVRVARDPTSGQCKGYGFVTFGSYNASYNAIQAMNGYRIENKRLSVSFKK